MYVNSDEQNENDNEEEGEEHIGDIMHRYIFKGKLDERKYFARKKV